MVVITVQVLLVAPHVVVGVVAVVMEVAVEALDLLPVQVVQAAAVVDVKVDVKADVADNVKIHPNLLHALAVAIVVVPLVQENVKIHPNLLHALAVAIVVVPIVQENVKRHVQQHAQIIVVKIAQMVVALVVITFVEIAVIILVALHVLGYVRDVAWARAKVHVEMTAHIHVQEAVLAVAVL